MKCATSKGTALGDRLYGWLGPPAHFIKVLLQMAVAVWAIVALTPLVHRTCSFSHALLCSRFPPEDSVLTVIGEALVVAAAIELAYTLFTPGPDEALNPLMLGVASTALLKLSSAKLDVKNGIALLCYALALSVLFAIRLFLATDLDPHLDKRGKSLPWWAQRRWEARQSLKGDATGQAVSRPSEAVKASKQPGTAED
jgi:hypothetical protein